MLDAYETSLLMLAAHDDKRNPGAGIASPTMPWGWGQLTIDRKDKRSAPYHLVWPRDLYQVATAEIAAGAVAPANAKLDFLLNKAQRADGHFPQNVQVTGRQKWTGIQMDEQAFPIVLAWQLQRFDAATWRKLRRTAEFIVRHGPETEQDRWENQSGYSPGTIAAQVAGLVAAADLARRNGATADATRYERVADRWANSVQRWTATTNGPYSDDPYYLRLTKDRRPDRGTRYSIGDGGPKRADQRKVVDPSFLELVRLGVKRFDDPVILNTLAVVDARLRSPDAQRGVLAPLHLRRLRRARQRHRLGADEGELAPDLRAAVADLRRRARRVRAAGRPARRHLPEVDRRRRQRRRDDPRAGVGRPPADRAGRRARAPSRRPRSPGRTRSSCAWPGRSMRERPVEQPSIVACRYVRTCDVAALSSVADLAPERGFSLPGAS